MVVKSVTWRDNKEVQEMINEWMPVMAQPGLSTCPREARGRWVKTGRSEWEGTQCMQG